jgi:hypothetical protein
MRAEAAEWNRRRLAEIDQELQRAIGDGRDALVEERRLLLKDINRNPAHAKKSTAQLDAEIAKALAKALVKPSPRVITAYHGSDAPIRRFDPSYSAQGVFWFSEDKDKILGGESGAVSAKHLIKVLLRVDKTAGWDEYDRYSLAELENLGYDSIHLDDDWVIFDPSRIRIVGTSSKARRHS